MIGFRETTLDELSVDHEIQVSTLTGSARLTVPIRTSPGRESFGPHALAPKEDGAIRAEHIAILARSRIHLKATLAALDERGVDYHLAAGGDPGVFDSDHYRIVEVVHQDRAQDFWRDYLEEK